MVDVIVPLDMWEEDQEGVIVSWLYENGSTVKEGEPICEVMVEKAQGDIMAPASGVLSITEVADAVVVKGQVVGAII